MVAERGRKTQHLGWMVEKAVGDRLADWGVITSVEEQNESKEHAAMDLKMVDVP